MGLLARIYDLQLPLERRALAAAVDLATVRHHDRLLDIATGTGGLLREVAQRDIHPTEVIGIDRYLPALAIAAHHLPAGWRLAPGDARQLPFAADSFDVVSACYLLHLLNPAESTEVLREIARVLRPGGRVVTVTVHSRRPATRTALSLAPRSSGLRPLDPADALVAAGLVPERARFIPSGWPSLCVLATSPM